MRSDDFEHTDKVEVQAVLASTGEQDVLIEQIMGRLSLAPGVSGVSWKIVAEQESPGTGHGGRRPRMRSSSQHLAGGCLVAVG